MKFRLLSDIHLEFSSYDVEPLEDDKDTVLLLAGDISVAKYKPMTLNFMEKVSKQFKTVLWIFGNHEYYKGSLGQSRAKADELICDLDNVFLLENEEFEFEEDNIVVLGATLWTDLNNGNPLTRFDVENSLADYSQIRLGVKGKYRKMHTMDVMGMHQTSKCFLFESIEKHKKDGKKVVVMTHHAPTWKSVSPGFKGDKLNGAYVSDLSEQILDTQPEIWVHGHLHAPCDYMVDNTRVYCNPRGYVGHEPDTGYDPLLTFTV